MDIFETRESAKVTLAIEGRLDAASVHALEAYFEKVREGAESLVLDFSAVNYIASAALRVLIVMQKWTNAHGKKLAICNLSAAVRDVFETTGMLSLFVRDEQFVIVETAKLETSRGYAFHGEYTSRAIEQIKCLFDTLAKQSDVTEVIIDCAKAGKATREVKTLFEKTKEAFAARDCVLRIVHVNP